ASMIDPFHTIEQLGGAPRFLEQYGKRRDVVIPFDERRTRPESRERFFVEPPHVGGNARAVIVDAQRASVRQLPNRVTGQMDLADRVRRQRREIRGRVPAVIATADEDIVDVAQDAAAGALGYRRDEFPFGNARLGELQVGRRVLEENLTPET